MWYLMVEADFGESNFMRDLMHELKIKFPEKIAGHDYTPTQNDEKYYGSDVIFPTDFPNDRGDFPFITVFLQFKRSDKLTVPQANHWDKFDGKHYRFDIHSQNQHNTLVRLDGDLGHAGYIAPGYHENEERHKYIDNKSVLEHSLFLQPDEKVLNSDHEIRFTISPIKAKLFSEPIDIEKLSLMNAFLESVIQQGSQFETFAAQREAFREFRFELNEEIDHISEEDIYIQDDEVENLFEWINNQKFFYNKYLNINPIFFFDFPRSHRPIIEITRHY